MRFRPIHVCLWGLEVAQASRQSSRTSFVCDSSLMELELCNSMSRGSLGP
jgi:hypothetical protein